MLAALTIVLAFGTSAMATTSTIYANVTGDIVLGGLFPVHRRGNDGESCGEIQASRESEGTEPGSGFVDGGVPRFRGRTVFNRWKRCCTLCDA